MFRVYRETHRKYVGPYPVQRIDGTQVFVIINEREVQHNLDQVILAKKYDELVNGECSMNLLHTSTKQFRSTKSKKNPTYPK